MERRLFLKSLFAASTITAVPSWAEVGSPAYLGAAKTKSGVFVIAGIGAKGNVLFQTPLPLRGHGFAAHPKLAIAVAFARRPGDLALIINLATGEEIARLDISDFGHFYGHGVFTPDAKYLLTIENDLETSEGRIGIWDVEKGYERIGSKATGGVGPHEIITLPDGGFAVANGGILTDPSFGREKLNIATMDPSLAILDNDLNIIAQHRPPEELHQLSIRHLAVSDREIGIGMQWEGDPREAQPVVGRATLEGLVLVEDAAEFASNYIGSVAANAKGDLGFSAPRSGQLITLRDDILRTTAQPDVYGIAGNQAGFMSTSNEDITFFEDGRVRRHEGSNLIWDNHLLSI